MHRQLKLQYAECAKIMSCLLCISLLFVKFVFEFWIEFMWNEEHTTDQMIMEDPGVGGEYASREKSAQK